MSELTQILHALPADGCCTCDDLSPAIYRELRKLAAARMAREAAGQTLQPTALVHEMWMRVTGSGGKRWQNRTHFFREASETMRRILIERARWKSRMKRGSGHVCLNIDDLELAETAADDRVLLINDALEQLELENPQMAQIVVLKFFGGLSTQEAAESLSLSPRTIERQWNFAKAWLFQCIQAQL